ncbi:MAG: DUF1444 family protein [Burkholderiaceae bacterium]|nr:DUF1444 family protein [Burkholderiaceae bacterium]
MKRLPLLVVVFFSVTSWAQELSTSQFTARFVKNLAAASPATKVTVKGPLELQIEPQSGDIQSVFLDNAYRTYAQDPKAIEEVLRRYVSSTLEPQQQQKQVDRSRIIPIIKDRAWLVEIAHSLQSRGLNSAPENVFEEFGDELLVVYAEDTLTNIRYLTRADLKESGLTQAQLRPLAVQNLGRILPQVEIHKGALVSMITAGGNFEANLLALPDIWKDLEQHVDGDIVVAIPARDLLLLTGSKTPGGIAKLRELAAKAYRESSYQLTDTLFVRCKGRFIKLPAQ